MAINGQYSDPPFGMSAAIAHTGAGGSPSALPTSDAPVLESGVVISVPGQSSQVAPDTAVVHLGDTAAASFGPIPERGDPLTGISAEALTSTGSGHGSTHDPHPNSMSVPSLADQLNAVRRPS